MQVVFVDLETKYDGDIAKLLTEQQFKRVQGLIQMQEKQGDLNDGGTDQNNQESTENEDTEQISEDEKNEILENSEEVESDTTEDTEEELDETIRSTQWRVHPKQDKDGI